MKKLSDLEAEIKRCSKCGKCQEVCPVYKITGNDCAVTRGKFIMLSGVLKGDLKLNKTIEKYLDLCTKCGKCKDFCPSGINVCEIFNIAKHECINKSFSGKIIKLFQSRKIFNNFLKMGQLFKHNKNLTNGSTKVLYFKGCVNKLYPKSENALKKILLNFDVELLEKDFDCCGIPFLSSGNIERYEEAKNFNLKLLDDNYDYVITDCASCENTIRNYKANAEYSQKIINVFDLIVLQDKKFVYNKPLKVTFHKPCHLESDAFLKPLLEKCKNIEYIESKDYDECCGFAGEFALKNPKLSFRLTQKKAENLLETGADVILTTCPACIIGIYQGFLGKKHPKILNITEFLAMADQII